MFLKLGLGHLAEKHLVKFAVRQRQRNPVSVAVAGL